MSFTVIRRLLDDEDEAEVEDSTVKVDLKVTSASELEQAATAIQEALQARNSPDLGLVAKQMQHIENELGTDVKSMPISLDYLELLQRYLSRFTLESLSSELTAKHKKLLLDVQSRLKSHSQASEDRSGDKAGKEDEFTYLKIPLNRRRQTLVMLICSLMTGPPLIMTTLFLIWYLVPYSTYLFLLYAAWVTYDNMTRPMPAPKRVVQSWRASSFYRAFRDYFPLRVVLANKPGKEKSPFDPSGHYLFCYHPHGVQSSGAFIFATAAGGFDELFPGLSCSVQTLGINFKMPVTREIMIALGMGDASKACLLKALGGAPGSSAMLVTGGAKESMYAHPGNSKVVMKDRMGFVKIAITSGTALVPVWGFGENNLYENLANKSSAARKCQRRMQKVISVAPLLMEGRGVFSYGGGFLPHRRPITVVIGDPIVTGKPEPNPSNERIAEVHKQYQEALSTLFNTYKDIYDPKAEPLEFV